MGKPLLIFALHMKAPRMFDKHVRLEVDRIAHVTLLKHSSVKPSSNILWSNVAPKVLVPSFYTQSYFIQAVLWTVHPAFLKSRHKGKEAIDFSTSQTASC